VVTTSSGWRARRVTPGSASAECCPGTGTRHDDPAPHGCGL
jgi:hypothetical protein